MRAKNYKIEVFRDSSGQFRAAVKHWNGRYLIQSTEAYKRRVDLINMLHTFFNNIREMNYEFADREAVPVKKWKVVL